MQITKQHIESIIFLPVSLSKKVEVFHKICNQSGAYEEESSPLCTTPVTGCPNTGDVSRAETQGRWGQKGSQNVLASFLPGFPLPSAWLTKEINNAALLCPPSHALPHLSASWMATTWSPSKSILQSPEVKHMGNKALRGVKIDHISLADGGRHGNQWRAKDIFLLFYVKCMCWGQGWRSWRTFFHWAFGFP